MNESDYIFKIIVIGNSSVGKTCVTERYTNGNFPESSKASIGVSFFTKEIEKEIKINGKIEIKKIRLQIWDTAGAERFQSMTAQFYRGASAAIIIYGLDNNNSLKDISTWFKQLKKINDGIPVVVAGNKSDINEKERTITNDSIERLNNNPNIESSYLISALSGDNINRLFDHVTNLCLQEHFSEKKTIKKIDITDEEQEAAEKFGIILLDNKKKDILIKKKDGCGC